MPDPQIYTKEELLSRIVKGDVAAFNDLFLDMYAPLHLLASRLSGVEEYAKDIVSDTFLRLWENRGSLAAVQDLKAYLYVSVRHRTLDYLKKKQRSHRREEKALEADWMGATSDNFLPELLGAEKTRELYRIIQELPPECKRVVLLGLEGYTTREIAVHLSVSASAVSNQKARAVKLLRDKLEPGLLLFVLFWAGLS